MYKFIGLLSLMAFLGFSVDELQAQEKADVVIECELQKLFDSKIASASRMKELWRGSDRGIGAMFDATLVRCIVCLPDSVADVVPGPRFPCDFYLKMDFAKPESVAILRKSLERFPTLEIDNQNDYEIVRFQGTDNFAYVFGKDWIVMKSDAYEVDEGNFKLLADEIKDWKRPKDRAFVMAVDVKSNSRFLTEWADLMKQQLGTIELALVAKQLDRLDLVVDLDDEEALVLLGRCANRAIAEDFKEFLTSGLVDIRQTLEKNKHKSPIEELFWMALREAEPKRDGNQVDLVIRQPEQTKVLLQKLHSEALIVQRIKYAKQVGLGTHNFHDTYGHFPFNPGEGENANLSWRVRTLPYLEENDLFGLFDTDQPWDSETNKRLLELAPDVYTAGESTTSWIQSDVRSFGDIIDGSSNTIALIVTKKNLNWTEPNDLNAEQALEEFRKLKDDEPMIVVLYDGSVSRIYKDMGEESFKAMLTPNGNEVIQR